MSCNTHYLSRQLTQDACGEDTPFRKCTHTHQKAHGVVRSAAGGHVRKEKETSTEFSKLQHLLFKWQPHQWKGRPLVLSSTNTVKTINSAVKVMFDIHGPWCRTATNSQVSEQIRFEKNMPGIDTVTATLKKGKRSPNHKQVLTKRGSSYVEQNLTFVKLAHGGLIQCQKDLPSTLKREVSSNGKKYTEHSKIISKQDRLVLATKVYQICLHAHQFFWKMHKGSNSLGAHL